MEKVFFTKTITPEKITEIITAAQIQDIVKKNDLCAVKTHFGEKGNTGYIKPELIKPVVEKIKKLGALPFLTDANTIYVGQRADSVRHMLTAYEHNFDYKNIKCPVIIADGLLGNSYVDVEVNLKHSKVVQIANAIHYSNSIVCVTHVKGHMAFGLAGSIKNIGMGCAARPGKYKLHCTVKPLVNSEKCTGCGICVKDCPGNALTLKDKNQKIEFNKDKCIGCGECVASCSQHVFRLYWNEEAVILCEKTAEFCLGVLKNKKAIFVNIINNVTKNCDCIGKSEKPEIADIGIVVSTDIVAADQASADLLNKAFGSDFYKHIWPGLDWQAQLVYAEKIGLGSRKYELVEL